MDIDIQEIFPDFEVKTLTTDDYSKITLAFENENSGKLIITMPRLNPHEIMYDWWEDVTISFEASKKGFDVTIEELIEKLQLIISELQTMARNRDEHGPGLTFGSVGE